jgi:predicted membrane chloride channel (bestrophin family)
MGTYQIALEIENPFGYDDNDLPLERYCEEIECDVALLQSVTLMSQGVTQIK